MDPLAGVECELCPQHKKELPVLLWKSEPSIVTCVNRERGLQMQAAPCQVQLWARAGARVRPPVARRQAWMRRWCRLLPGSEQVCRTPLLCPLEAPDTGVRGCLG